MSTLDLFSTGVHHIPVSISAGPRASGTVDSDQLQTVGVVAILIAVLLLGAALKQLGRAFVPIGELVRMVLSGLAVAVLLIGAIALLIGVLVATAGSR
ncbi:MAG TPA: hypothetical protein VH502_06905 [Actinoplanes sp.]|jgi:hypothetical protein